MGLVKTDRDPRTKQPSVKERVAGAIVTAVETEFRFVSAPGSLSSVLDLPGPRRARGVLDTFPPYRTRASKTATATPGVEEVTLAVKDPQTKRMYDVSTVSGWSTDFPTEPVFGDEVNVTVDGLPWEQAGRGNQRAVRRALGVI